jgi:hypothetical protein
MIPCCSLLALKARENGIDLVTDSAGLPVDRRSARVPADRAQSCFQCDQFTERGGKVTFRNVEGSLLMLRVADRGRDRGRRSEADRRAVLPAGGNLSAHHEGAAWAFDRQEPDRTAWWR